MPARTMVRCAICKSLVREDRLSAHVSRVHGDVFGHHLPERIATEGASNAEGAFLNAACSCGGQNNNCFRCGGWGYIDSIAQGRNQHSEFVAGTIANKKKVKNPRRPKAKQSPQIEGKGLKSASKKCYLCSAKVGDLEAHMKVFHGVIRLGIRSSFGKNTRLIHSSKNVDRRAVLEKNLSNSSGRKLTRDIERNLDGARDYYSNYREQGRFGSHPSHDDYGDDSDP